MFPNAESFLSSSILADARAARANRFERFERLELLERFERDSIGLLNF
jgi:hypothetical protein